MNFFDFSEIHGKSMETNAKMKKIGLQKVDLVCICEFLRGAGRFSHEGMEIAVKGFQHDKKIKSSDPQSKGNMFYFVYF